MKFLLLTIISTTALLLIGQSVMALEQINSENGYDPAARNGRVSSETTTTGTSLESIIASFRTNTVVGPDNPNSIDYMSSH